VEYESRRTAVRNQEREMNQRRLDDPSLMEDERQHLAEEEKKYEVMLRRQNKLMHVCLLMLLHFAEDYAVEKKMVE